LGVNTLSHTELPAQLHTIGRVRLGSALRATIDDVLSLPELTAQVEALDDAGETTIGISRPLSSRA
jgi:hypothetical protein